MDMPVAFRKMRGSQQVKAICMEMGPGALRLTYTYPWPEKGLNAGPYELHPGVGRLEDILPIIKDSDTATADEARALHAELQKMYPDCRIIAARVRYSTR